MAPVGKPDLIERLEIEISKTEYGNLHNLLNTCKRALCMIEGAIHASPCPEHEQHNNACLCCDCDMLAGVDCNCIRSLTNKIYLRK